MKLHTAEDPWCPDAAVELSSCRSRCESMNLQEINPGTASADAQCGEHSSLFTVLIIVVCVITILIVAGLFIWSWRTWKRCLKRGMTLSCQDLKIKTTRSLPCTLLEKGFWVEPRPFPCPYRWPILVLVPTERITFQDFHLEPTQEFHQEPLCFLFDPKNWNNFLTKGWEDQKEMVLWGTCARDCLELLKLNYSSA